MIQLLFMLCYAHHKSNKINEYHNIILNYLKKKTKIKQNFKNTINQIILSVGILMRKKGMLICYRCQIETIFFKADFHDN